ncbi:MAG: Dam-replacing family [Candidatus Roizmanbacteria bacterium GW2011_GWB1_40_7]|uniref:Dam-replacing family n=1 Tax=Candidatus Roizmanbacteria bacterium GW2011_GWB1_40_7 TaxID=1618482 RepID=A0A0G0T2P0_9BACT|nr:MAG: Dam-replacing family [Candidatus Levybacteria bacterium GW2011_GWA1_37_16]KKR71294.1 MAG: Dam-replacing family [Candidatus Roizmanbacteria bacterium GW2011_GWB1_40_7]OGH51187.1 MAG: restriction endonuclease [Candidatus Levybacteria bacterium RIFCSPLOWO2_12_FULL_37_14]
MNLFFDTKLADRYTSFPQKIRVLTEDWVNRQVYCPNCGHLDIDKYGNNMPVADFFCSNCKEDYELKSKKDAVGTKIVDGAYRTMIDRLQSTNNPNFFLLNYDLINFSILNFFVIPKHFFVPEIIEERKPLAVTARRAGWKRTLFLREEKEIGAKGWLLDIMNCIEKLASNNFILDDVYAFKNVLSRKHPRNKHIKDKIRQQLQILRDKDYLQFLGSGKYMIT